MIDNLVEMPYVRHIKIEGANEMKTFKLKGLEVMGNEQDGIEQKAITLTDGLVINREDNGGWLLEAYVDEQYRSYFEKLINIKEIMLQVKITREENDPAFFITEILSINEISKQKINVLFGGRVIDHSKSRVEDMLRMIMEEGYQGESLLKKFKELI